MTGSSDVQRRPFLGALLLTVAILVAVSLLSSPPWWGSEPFPGLPRDACGIVGRIVASLLLGELGVALGPWMALCLFALAGRWLFLHPSGPWKFLLWGGLTSFVLSTFAAASGGREYWGTAALAAGSRLAETDALGPVGAPLTLGALFAVLLLAGILHWTPSRVRRRAAQAAGETVAGLGTAAGGAAQDLSRRSGGWLRALFRRRGGKGAAAESPRAGASGRGKGARTPGGARPGSPLDDEAAEETAHAGGLLVAGGARSGAPFPFGAPDRDPDGAGVAGLREGAHLSKPDSRGTAPRKRGRDAAGARPADARAEGGARGELSGEGYVLPPIALLEQGQAAEPIHQGELLETSRTLMRTLHDFGIAAKLGQIHPGPVITQYEVEPAAGVRVAQFVSRTEDLALALRASRIRLVAPIPGKAAVGVEVPNRVPSPISLRSVIEEIDASAIRAELPVVLGRDIRGRPVVAGLNQMPHLLVAGTTGSGKSVFLNALLISLLLRRTPEELRLLLIDPKMLELTPYDDIPHLIAPVVTEGKVAARMLQWLVGEMERRYRRLAAVGVRNLEGYRARAAAAESGLESMPYIVVVVDELADLMLTLANEIESPIARLAQMARAVGIHLVLATQRPSVDVITGVIKANFPARIAFQVASKVDSRTILDANGAESLLGRGDMLFLPPGKAEALRVHGAYVSERDAEGISAFLRSQPPAPALIKGDLVTAGEAETSIEDELFEDALRLIVQHQQASVSFLQRRLKIGYSRAGRLMDLLEQAGAVGAQDGSKTREVLADQDFLERWRSSEVGDAAPSP